MDSLICLLVLLCVCGLGGVVGYLFGRSRGTVDGDLMVRSFARYLLARLEGDPIQGVVALRQQIALWDHEKRGGQDDKP